MHDIAIVGGGVVGLSLARALARAGASVVLFERAATETVDRGWACEGASSLPVALVNPWRGRKGAAHPDDRAGLDATWRWSDELLSEGLNAGADRRGVLRVPTSERQARRWHARANDEASLRWLAPEAVPGDVRAPHGALLVRDGGWIRADAWRSALATSSRRHGAELHAGAWITGLERHGEGWRLSRADGGVHVARVVLLAVGADTPPTPSIDGTSGSNGSDGRDGSDGSHRGEASDGGTAWPDWIRTRGEEIALASDGVPRTPIAGGVYATWDGTDAWVGGGHRPADRADPDAPSQLRRAIAESVPDLGRASIRHVWSGVRAKRADARPVIEPWRDGLWIVGAFAGRGFLCAALEAERLADAWRDGQLGSTGS